MPATVTAVGSQAFHPTLRRSRVADHSAVARVAAASTTAPSTSRRWCHTMPAPAPATTAIGTASATV